MSHGYGVLKLLSMLPEIAQKALVAGLAREKENVKQGISKKTDLKSTIIQEAVQSIEVLIIFLELGLFGNLAESHLEKREAILKLLQVIIKEGGKSAA